MYLNTFKKVIINVVLYCIALPTRVLFAIKIIIIINVISFRAVGFIYKIYDTIYLFTSIIGDVTCRNS